MRGIWSSDAHEKTLDIDDFIVFIHWCNCCQGL
jgi:hypothetical protein